MMLERIRLSQNFYLHEFLRSQEAARSGRQIEASEQIIAELKRLCLFVLEPIRAHFDDRVITILSGYRPLWVNQAIGGATKSEHMEGRAADLVISGFTPLQVARGIVAILPALPVNQLIHEFDQWTHVSICEEAQPPRREILTAKHVRGRAQYLPGLPVERTVV